MPFYRPQNSSNGVCVVVGGGLGSADSVVGLVILEGFSHLCDSINLLILMF